MQIMKWVRTRIFKQTLVPQMVVETLGLPPILVRCEDAKLRRLLAEFSSDRPLFWEIAQAYCDYYAPQEHPMAVRLREALDYFARADRSLKAKQFAAALKDYQKGLMLYPYYTLAKINMASIEFLQQNYERALEILRDTEQMAPHNPLVAINMAKVYRALERTDEAVAALFTARDLLGGEDAYCTKELIDLGALVMQSRWDAKLQRKTIVYYRAAEYRAFVMDELKRIKSAREGGQVAFEELLMEMVQNRSMLLFQEIWQEHAGHFYKGIESWSERAFLLAGHALSAQKEVEQAQVIWQQGLERFPRSGPLHANLAKLLRQTQARLHHLDMAMEVGEISGETIFLYFETLKEQVGEGPALEKLLALYHSTGHFDFVRFVAFRKYFNDPSGLVLFLLTYIEPLESKEKFTQLGQLATYLASKEKYAEVILLLERYAHSEHQEFMIYWHLLTAYFHLGRQEKVQELLDLVKQNPHLSVQFKSQITALLARPWPTK